MSCVCACADSFIFCVFPFASVSAISVESASLDERMAEIAENVGRFIWFLTFELRGAQRASRLNEGLGMNMKLSRFITSINKYAFYFCNWFWSSAKFFYFMLKCDDPVIRRYILHLKFRNLLMKFKVLCLQLSYIKTEWRLSRLEKRLNIGRFAHDIPNVELTGAARLYRAASSDRRERG